MLEWYRLDWTKISMNESVIIDSLLSLHSCGSLAVSVRLSVQYADGFTQIIQSDFSNYASSKMRYHVSVTRRSFCQFSFLILRPKNTFNGLWGHRVIWFLRMHFEWEKMQNRNSFPSWGLRIRLLRPEFGEARNLTAPNRSAPGRENRLRLPQEHIHLPEYVFIQCIKENRTIFICIRCLSN